MRATRHMIATGFAAASLLSAAALPAHAACSRLGFSVNDYGKDGPIKDAKALLDKYVAKWAADRNIAKYRTGPKSVNCELFLDVIVFDEHTCRAEATVCWDGPALAKPQAAGASGDAAQPDAKPAAKSAKASDTGTGSSAVKRADVPAGAIKVKPAKIETGALPVAAPAATPAVATPVAVPAAVISKPAVVAVPTKEAVVPVAVPAPSDAANQAVLAAEKAAAAAERAALAAERAAAAAAKIETAPASKP